MNNTFEAFDNSNQDRSPFGASVMNQLRRIDAGVVGITVLSIGCLGIAGYGYMAGRQQDAGIRSSLTTEGTQDIPGFEAVSVDGNMVNYSPGSLHGATVTLTSGLECEVQFTTVSGSGLWEKLGPTHAKIVSFGTCPTDIPALNK